MDIGILGPLTVTLEGSEIAVGAPKQRALLALLVLRRNQVVPTWMLIDEIWHDRPPSTAPKIIQGYVSQLRKAIGPRELETHLGGYRFSTAPDDVDADRFEALMERGRGELAAGRPELASGLLRQALTLWRGAALAEFQFDGWASDELERLGELRALAQESRLEVDIALGNHASAIPELQRLVREAPLRESLRGLLMLALYRAGRQADALAVYGDTRTVLAEELGVDPGEELQRLHAGILNHDPALAPPTVSPASPAGTVTAHPPHSDPGSSASGARISDPATDTEAVRPATVVALPVALPGGSPGRQPSDTPLPTRRRARPRRNRWRRARVAMAACLTLVSIGALGLTSQGATPAGQTLTANSVGFVTLNGSTVSNQVSIPGSPTAVAVEGPVVWAVVPEANTLIRIDATTSSVVQTLAVGKNPSAVAIGGGSVWVANHDDDTVYRVSPETNTVVDRIPVGAGPVALAEGFGSIWVSNGDDRTLTRIDETTDLIVKTIHTNAVGNGVAIADGLVWVTDEATDRIIGVNPATNVASAAATVGNGPTGIAAAHGALWVVNALDGTVSRVDPLTDAVTKTLEVSDGPSAIGAGAGVVWVSEEFGSHLVRIDAAQGVITGSIPLESRPEALAATDAGVWVSAQSSGSGHRGGRLVVMGSVDSIDPSVGELSPEPEDLAYDALTFLREPGGIGGIQVVPDLAVSLPLPTAAGTSYTFHLVPNIRYSDGRPLQAADFRLGLERLLRLNSAFAGLFSHVIGAQRCAPQTPCDLSAGVLVENASTVTFRLSSPDPRFLEELSNLIPIPAGTPMQDVGTSPVPGTGPYAITSYVPGHLLTFDRNRYFTIWSPAAQPDGYPDEVTYIGGTSDDDAVGRVVAGQADVVQLVGEPAAVQQLAARHPGQVHTEHQQSTVFVFLNTRTPPFDDIRVRQALNFAVDRDQVAASYGSAVAIPTCQIIPPTTTGYRPYCPYTVDADPSGLWRGPDLTKAQALVDDSGTTGERVVLWTPSGLGSEANYVSGVLDRLGYRSSVHEITNEHYFDTLDKTPQAQAGMFGWFGMGIGVDMLSTLTCDYDPNPAHFCNPRIDAQIQHLADTEPADPAGSSDLAAQIDREITDQAPWVPLFTPQTVDVTSARVGNYQTELGQLRIDQLWVQ